jgi:tetratricopeptide (TPR) repeat protein
MDLTMLAAAVAVALGLMTADASLSSDKVMVDVAVPASYTQAGVNTDIVEAIYLAEIQQIIDTPSVVPPPAIRGTREKSLASSLADALQLGEVGRSVQRMLGYDPPHIRASLIVEQETTKFIVVESSRNNKNFEFTLEQRPNEPIVELIKRGAAETIYQIEPYLALVHAMLSAQNPDDFAKLSTSIKQLLAALPNVPVSPVRSQYENLLGIIQLLSNDIDGAADSFNAATLSDTHNAVAVLNLGFIECQRDRYAESERIVRRVVEPAPLTDQPVLLGAAYMTWACALMGQQNFAAADQKLAQAIKAYPYTSSGYQLWSELKKAAGNPDEAKALRRKARENSIYFEQFSEVAMLYFELSWRDKEALRRSKFSNPNGPRALLNAD